MRRQRPPATAGSYSSEARASTQQPGLPLTIPRLAIPRNTTAEMYRARAATERAHLGPQAHRIGGAATDRQPRPPATAPPAERARSRHARLEDPAAPADAPSDAPPPPDTPASPASEGREHIDRQAEARRVIRLLGDLMLQRKTRNHAHELFLEFDLDRNGRVTGDEIKMVLRNKAYLRLSDEATRELERLCESKEGIDYEHFQRTFGWMGSGGFLLDDSALRLAAYRESFDRDHLAKRRIPERALSQADYEIKWTAGPKVDPRASEAALSHQREKAREAVLLAHPWFRNVFRKTRVVDAQVLQKAVEDVAQISSSEAEKLVEEASAGRGIVEYEDFINIIRQADGSCTNRIVVPALRHHLPPDYRAGRVEAEALLALRQSSQQSQSTVFDETWNSGFTVSTSSFEFDCIIAADLATGFGKTPRLLVDDTSPWSLSPLAQSTPAPMSERGRTRRGEAEVLQAYEAETLKNKEKIAKRVSLLRNHQRRYQEMIDIRRWHEDNQPRRKAPLGLVHLSTSVHI